MSTEGEWIPDPCPVCGERVTALRKIEDRYNWDLTVPPVVTTEYRFGPCYHMLRGTDPRMASWTVRRAEPS